LSTLKKKQRLAPPPGGDGPVISPQLYDAARRGVGKRAGAGASRSAGRFAPLPVWGGPASARAGALVDPANLGAGGRRFCPARRGLFSPVPPDFLRSPGFSLRGGPGRRRSGTPGIFRAGTVLLGPSVCGASAFRHGEPLWRRGRCSNSHAAPGPSFHRFEPGGGGPPRASVAALGARWSGRCPLLFRVAFLAPRSSSRGRPRARVQQLTAGRALAPPRLTLRRICFEAVAGKSPVLSPSIFLFRGGASRSSSPFVAAILGRQAGGSVTLPTRSELKRFSSAGCVPRAVLAMVGRGRHRGPGESTFLHRCFRLRGQVTHAFSWSFVALCPRAWDAFRSRALARACSWRKAVHGSGVCLRDAVERAAPRPSWAAGSSGRCLLWPPLRQAGFGSLARLLTCLSPILLGRFRPASSFPPRPSPPLVSRFHPPSPPLILQSASVRRCPSLVMGELPCGEWSCRERSLRPCPPTFSWMLDPEGPFPCVSGLRPVPRVAAARGRRSLAVPPIPSPS